MKNSFKKIFYSLIVIFVFFIFIPVTQANSPFGNGLNEAAAKSGHLASNYMKPDNLPGALGYFIRVFYLGIAGIAYLILIIYAGIIWMNASGNEEKVEKAKSVIKNATLGLIVVLMAYAVTIFVALILVGVTY